MRKIYALALAPAVVAVLLGAGVSVLFAKLQAAETGAAVLRQQLRANEQMVRYASAMAGELYHSVWEQSGTADQHFGENKQKLLALRDQLRQSTKGTEVAQQYVVEDRTLDEFLTACEQFRLPNGQAKLVVKLSDFQQQDGYLKNKLTEILEKRNTELNVLSAQTFNVVVGAAVLFILTMIGASWSVLRAMRRRLEKMRALGGKLRAAQVADAPASAPNPVPVATDDAGVREQYIRELDEAVKAFATEQPEP